MLLWESRKAMKEGGRYGRGILILGMSDTPPRNAETATNDALTYIIKRESVLDVEVECRNEIHPDPINKPTTTPTCTNFGIFSLHHLLPCLQIFIHQRHGFPQRPLPGTFSSSLTRAIRCVKALKEAACASSTLTASVNINEMNYFTPVSKALSRRRLVTRNAFSATRRCSVVMVQMMDG